MGTDIHLRTEVRDPRTRQWSVLGAVFDSDSDWDWPQATRETLDALSDGELLDAVASLGARDSEVGVGVGVRDALGEAALAAMSFHRDRMTADGERVTALRESIPAEEWDYYGKVQPFERQLRRERREATKLDPELRENIIAAVAGFRYEHEDADDEDERRVTISLERAEGDPPFKTAEVYEGRNYDLFAILAGVRNGSGFAGVDTGDAVEPIAEGRGCPEDASEEGVRWMEHADHSLSYVTLAELQAHDWETPKVQRGVVEAEVYERMMAERGEMVDPLELGDGYSGGISGGGIVTFTPEGYEEWKAKGRPAVRRSRFGDPIVGEGPKASSGRAAEFERRVAGALGVAERADEETVAGVEVRPYVKVEWTETHRSAAGEPFLTETIPALERVIPEGGGPEDVRLLMWFDS